MNGKTWTQDMFGNHQVGVFDFNSACVYKVFLVSLLVREYGVGIVIPRLVRNCSVNMLQLNRK